MFYLCTAIAQMSKSATKLVKKIDIHKLNKYMSKKIVLEHGNAVALGKRLGVCRKTVHNALNFRSDSQLERKIRFVAVRDFRGVEIEK